MALNNYQENQFLPLPTRAWLQTPNRVSAYRSYDFLRIFEGFDLMAILNNRYASDIASGYTVANVSNLMSGVAPRMQQILVSKIVNKVDFIGFEECKTLKTMLDKEYLTIKLKKAYNNAVRTGRDLSVLYPKYKKDALGTIVKKEITIQNVDCFRHILKMDDENIADVMILLNQTQIRANSYYNIFEHRYYDKDGKPTMEYQLGVMSWDNDRYESTKKRIFSKEEFKNLTDGIADEGLKEELAKYKFYSPVELPFDNLGCYPVVNTEYNSKYPMTNIPESRFVNVQDKIMEIETSNTYKEVDKEIGRGRVVVPSSYNFDGTAVSGNKSNLANTGAFNSPLDPTVFVKYQTNSMQDSAPQGIQFNLRADEWRTSVNGEVGDVCAAFGISILDYDPRMLQSGQRTDDEINAMTDITFDTVGNLRNMNEYQINKMLNTIAIYAGEKTPVAIKWNLSSIINPSKNQALIGQQLQNGTISRKEAIKRSNPDYTDAEVDEEFNKIEKERALSNPIF